MTRTGWSVAVVVLTAGLLWVGAAEAKGLPKAVRDAVAEAFPGAEVRSYGTEREGGLRFYEVDLVVSGKRIEVEVDKYGGIGEIERRIDVDEAPAALLKAIKEATGGKGKVRIERHERWGVGRGGRFQKLETPRVFYEVKLPGGSGRLESKWTPKPVSLPKNARKALEAEFPRAVITEVEREDEDGAALYEAALIHNGRDLEVEVTADGVIVEVGTPAALRSLPRAVQDTIRKVARGARIHEVEKTEVRAVVRNGVVKPLRTARLVYEAELRKGGKVSEVEISADGRVLEQSKWKKHDPFEDEDEDDDDDDDD